jgi:hypothetical protein
MRLKEQQKYLQLHFSRPITIDILWVVPFLQNRGKCFIRCSKGPATRRWTGPFESSIFLVWYSTSTVFHICQCIPSKVAQAKVLYRFLTGAVWRGGIVTRPRAARPRTRGAVSVFSRASVLALEPTQSLIQWAPRALSAAMKWWSREAHHSPSSN